MKRYVWQVEVYTPDGPEGGEDLGLFGSKVKAMTRAHQDAKRRLRWTAEDGHQPPRWYNATHKVRYKVDGERYDDEHRYTVIKRLVR